MADKQSYVLDTLSKCFPHDASDVLNDVSNTHIRGNALGQKVLSMCEHSLQQPYNVQHTAMNHLRSQQSNINRRPSIRNSCTRINQQMETLQLVPWHPQHLLTSACQHKNAPPPVHEVSTDRNYDNRAITTRIDNSNPTHSNLKNQIEIPTSYELDMRSGFAKGKETQVVQSAGCVKATPVKIRSANQLEQSLNCPSAAPIIHSEKINDDVSHNCEQEKLCTEAPSIKQISSSQVSILNECHRKRKCDTAVNSDQLNSAKRAKNVIFNETTISSISTEVVKIDNFKQINVDNEKLFKIKTEPEITFPFVTTSTTSFNKSTVKTKIMRKAKDHAKENRADKKSAKGKHSYKNNINSVVTGDNETKLKGAANAKYNVDRNTTSPRATSLNPVIKQEPPDDHVDTTGSSESLDTDSMDPEYSSSIDKFCMKILAGTTQSDCMGGIMPPSACNQYLNNFRKSLISTRENNALSKAYIGDICDKLFRDIRVSGWVKDMNNDYVYFLNGKRSYKIYKHGDVTGDGKDKMNSEDDFASHHRKTSKYRDDEERKLDDSSFDARATYGECQNTDMTLSEDSTGVPLDTNHKIDNFFDDVLPMIIKDYNITC